MSTEEQTRLSFLTAGGRLGFRHYLLVTVVGTYALMVLGAYTSAVGAGLSCPDWPQCYGVWFPFNNPEAMYNHPEFPGWGEAYTTWQIFVEWAHRGLAAIMGIFILAGMAYSWYVKKPRAVRWSLVGAVALLPFQVILGGLTVTERLDPVIVTSHLGTATVILLALTIATVVTWLHER